jgi:hypothetical protein
MAPVENDMPFTDAPPQKHISLWIILVFNPRTFLPTAFPKDLTASDLLPKDGTSSGHRQSAGSGDVNVRIFTAGHNIEIETWGSTDLRRVLHIPCDSIRLGNQSTVESDTESAIRDRDVL